MTAITARRMGSIRGQNRYGFVFTLVLALALFEITAPAADWSRAVAVLLAAAALGVAVATSRAPNRVRHARVRLIGAVAAVLIAGIATGAFGRPLTFAVVTVLVASIPVALGGGLLRLNKEAGVTLQVVAGALAMYLLIGLLFASVIEFVAAVQTGHFFKQGNVTTGEQVYYSFTVMTTTGFGDYTAATPIGHALAVLEMLTGQLYLVTVIGVIVGNFVGRGRPTAPPAEPS